MEPIDTEMNLPDHFRESRRSDISSECHMA
jgi:hypothetical protein